jgi:hypothetical protein
MEASGTTGVGDPIAERECLAGRIVEQVRRQGFYLADLDAQERQALIDLRWAALLAGRALGRRTTTHASAVGRRIPGKISVVVAPVGSGARVPVARDQARAIAVRLWGAEPHPYAHRRPA